MKTASWHYGHCQQILLDGTFGVCDRRVLLFIVMGIDKQNHGVPLTFFLFLAPGGNNATQSGYDTAILVKMLSQWKDSLTLYQQQEFMPSVAIMDTNFKERGALVKVFPGIKLLICRFHLRQKAVLDHLITLEQRLVESTNYNAAQDLVAEEVRALNQMAMNGIYASAAGKGVAHLKYLTSTWMSEALWGSWSNGGRDEGAAMIGVPVNEVIMANNPLELFNGLLKNKMLKGWSRGGRRVRVDILVFMLASRIAQGIFQQQRLEEEERKMLQNALEGIPGADTLFRDSRTAPIEPPVAYLCPDSRRDEEAHLLLHQNWLSTPIIHEQGIKLTCWSVRSTDASGAPRSYAVWLGFNGVGFCTCPDFQQRGGACKHMRAALYQLQGLKSWVCNHQINDPIAQTPNIELPTSKAAAIHAIAARNRPSGPDTTHEVAIPAELQPGQATNVLERVARCVNEASQGGFLGDLADFEESDEVEMGDSDSEGDAEGCMPSEVDFSMWSGGNQFRSNSARGVAEQVIAQTIYNIEQQSRMLANIHAALDQITHRDLENSSHRPTFEQYANELEGVTTRVQGLLRRSAPLFTSSQSTTQVPTQAQHDIRTTLLPPSPEKRQYRKESRGIH